MDSREGFLDTRVKDIAQLTTGPGDSEKGVLTADPSDTVFECIERMADRDVGSIVVMEGDAIVGIFTERDYMRKIALKGRSSKETRVREVMTSKVATVQPDDSLVDGLRIMTEIWCRHLPVVNDDEDLIGIVSIRDGVEEVINNAEQETDLLLQYINGQYSV
ncbi:MAG: CBS domain-containing protein [Bacteroidetes bacterium QH_7_62_13]|jgi:CBS domain-containing protein|nr:MAG: CBS domain-containing protein [Bacteroidetes bacterium QH_1_61_8]PSQ76722.1 MAG: CBS domain-containing protein [Bacteroidetes bacterium QH_7_62_13]